MTRRIDPHPHTHTATRAHDDTRTRRRTHTATHARARTHTTQCVCGVHLGEPRGVDAEEHLALQRGRELAQAVRGGKAPLEVASAEEEVAQAVAQLGGQRVCLAERVESAHRQPESGRRRVHRGDEGHERARKVGPGHTRCHHEDRRDPLLRRVLGRGGDVAVSHCGQRHRRKVESRSVHVAGRHAAVGARSSLNRRRCIKQRATWCLHGYLRVEPAVACLYHPRILELRFEADLQRP
jgi:hypothetical protein